MLMCLSGKGKHGFILIVHLLAIMDWTIFGHLLETYMEYWKPIFGHYLSAMIRHYYFDVFVINCYNEVLSETQNPNSDQHNDNK